MPRRVLTLVKSLRDWPVLRVIIGAVSRAMSRDVMLFAGGASFFGMLALFPAIALLFSAYGLVFSIEDARAQFERFAEIIPAGGQSFVIDQMQRLADAPIAALSFQGFLALMIALFAASRGAKALIAGLNHLAEDKDIRNVLHFNVLAMGSVLIGGALVASAQIAVLAIPTVLRRITNTLGLDPINFGVIINEWTAASLSMVIALTALYRWAMRRRSDAVSWPAAILAAAASTTLWFVISRGFSLYVANLVDFNIYGSLGALVVFLLWVYWSAYAVFFGGALAIELDGPKTDEDDEAAEIATKTGEG